MKLELKNATVVSVEDRLLKLQSGDRPMQLVQVSSRQDGQIVLDGVEVWDEAVNTFQLAQGQQVNLLCKTVADTWGGRYRYSLRVIKCEKITKQNEGGQDPFGV